MTKPNRYPSFTLRLLACALLAAAGCDDTNTREIEVGTETNWLTQCETNAECGAYTCECGVCTTPCSADSECSMQGAECSLAGEARHDALCVGQAAEPAGLCVDARGNEPDAAADDSAADDSAADDSAADDSAADDSAADDSAAEGGSRDGASRDDASPGGPSLDDSAADDSAADDSAADDSAADDSAADDSAADDSAVDDSAVDDGDASVPPDVADAGSDDPGGDASNPDDASEGEGGASSSCESVSRDGLTPGCCFDEGDCDSEQRCYQAVCSESAPAPGRCATPLPFGSCIDDRDCAAGERCNGGMLAACGTLGPDSIGSCEPEATELLSGYVLWDRPGGVAGTGPILELSEDGALRLWAQSAPFAPRGGADWDTELQLSPQELNEIVRLLQSVDYSSLPHEVSFMECYPNLYFEGPDVGTVQVSYGGAAGLLPEMQQVYDWFDALLAEQAPEHVGPSQYCP